MEKDFIENGKNTHTNFDALSEADFKERRVVFMGEEEPSGSGEGAEGAAEASEGLDLDDPGEKALDEAARDYLRNKLTGLALLAVGEMTIIAVEKDTSNKVTSVTAKVDGIRVTIDDTHSDNQISNFQADALRYKVQFTGLKFKDGSYVDISDKKASLLIEIDSSFKDATTDDLTVDIDVSTDTISDIRLDPSTSSEELRDKINSLKGKPVAELTRAVIQDLVTLQTAASEAGVDRELATADGATEDAPAGGTEEPPAESATPAEAEETPPVIDLGELLVAGGLSGSGIGIYKDKFKDGQKVIVPMGRERVEVTVHKEHGHISFTCNLPFFEGVKIPFELKDDGTAVMTFGDRAITLRVESGNGEGKITMEGLGVKGDDKFEIEFKGSAGRTSSGISATIDIEFKFNGEPVEEGKRFDFVSLLGGEANLKAAGFKDEQIADMKSMPLAPIAGTDEDSETGADSAEDVVTEGGAAGGAAEGGDKDTDQDKKRKSALERTFGREATENVGSFMETLEELAAVVLELLESLGFDLNPDIGKDGKERTPAEREGRRLWLFIGRYQLGTKNRGKLQSMKMDELMALYEDGDQAGTVALLDGAEFDVEGVHGEKLYEMLGHIHDIKGQDEGKSKDGKGAEKVAKYFTDNGHSMNLNTFLFETKMIDMNGRWSDGWKEFDGKTDAQKAEEAAAAAAEATKQNSKEQLSTILKNSEYMISMLYEEDPKNRNTLADKLQALDIVTPEAVKTFKDEGSTEEGLRTLLKTIEDKAYFFGDKNFNIDNAWPNLPDVAAIKARLEGTNPGAADTDVIANYFVNTGLSLGYDANRKVIKVDAGKKGDFKNLLSASIKDIEDSFNMLEGEGRSSFATNVGLKPEDLPTLIGWLHDPEHGIYNNPNMTLTTVYSLTKPYTLADLLSIMMTPAGPDDATT